MAEMNISGRVWDYWMEGDTVYMVMEVGRSMTLCWKELKRLKDEPKGELGKEWGETE